MWEDGFGGMDGLDEYDDMNLKERGLEGIHAIELKRFESRGLFWIRSNI